MKRKHLYQGFLRKYKNVYLFILILVTAGFCMGIFLSNYIDINDTSHLSNYLATVNEGVDKYAYFVNQFFLGILFIIFVFLLGTSIIGIPIVSFIAFSKGIQIGFSCALFVYTYQLKGIIGIILTLLPQILFDLLATFLISACAIQLSMYIMYSCTNREKLDFKKLCNSILNDIFISFILVLIASYIKAHVVIELIRIFNLI